MYKVLPDYDAFDFFYRDLDKCDLEEAIRIHESGELSFYSVEKYEKCACTCPKCDGWHLSDILGGIETTGPEEAIKEYMEATKG